MERGKPAGASDTQNLRLQLPHFLSRIISPGPNNAEVPSLPDISLSDLPTLSEDLHDVSADA